MTMLERGADTLEALYEEHGPALRRLCARRLGPGPDVDDAVQETLVRAWRGLDRFDATRPMWPWLATIAGNVCIDVQRHRQLVEDRSRGVLDLDHEATEDRALRHETGAVVREALGRMARPAATVLYLRDVEGWDYERIGAHLDRNPGAARTAVTRARHQLRAHVEEIARRRGHWPLSGIFGGWLARRRVRTSGARQVASAMGPRADTLAIDVLGFLGQHGAQIATGSVLLVGSILAGITDGGSSDTTDDRTAIEADGGGGASQGVASTAPGTALGTAVGVGDADPNATVAAIPGVALPQAEPHVAIDVPDPAGDQPLGEDPLDVQLVVPGKSMPGVAVALPSPTATELPTAP